MPRTAPTLPAGSQLIDSHCHLDLNFDEDREEVVRRATAAGVRRMITIGASDGMKHNATAVAIAGDYENIFATVGVHPHDAKIVDDAVVAELEALATNAKVVGIGETGLDYYYDNSPREQQQTAFRQFIDLARRTKLPCVVHLRDAYEDAVRIMTEERAAEVGGVIHCFSGDRENARSFLDLGFDLSFSGIVTFKNAEELRYVAAMVPEDRFHVETDAPFLAPVPFRGKRNEPSYVTSTAQTIADARQDTLANVAAAACRNTERLFQLAPSRSPIEP